MLDFYRSTNLCRRVATNQSIGKLTFPFFNYSHAADASGYIGAASTSCGAGGAITSIAFVGQQNFRMPKGFQARAGAAPPSPRPRALINARVRAL
jgi:hypothetical protein